MALRYVAPTTLAVDDVVVPVSGGAHGALRVRGARLMVGGADPFRYLLLVDQHRARRELRMKVGCYVNRQLGPDFAPNWACALRFTLNRTEILRGLAARVANFWLPRVTSKILWGSSDKSFLARSRPLP